MAKKDDRNLNITIKNQEDKADEVVVSISDSVSKLFKVISDILSHPENISLKVFISSVI